MDKNVLKKFAVESRKKLISYTQQAAAKYGIAKDNINPLTINGSNYAVVNSILGQPQTLNDDERKAREELIKKIESSSYDAVMEEVAYTIFNRLIAIRYMEVNDYLPNHIRALSSDIPNKKEPDLLTEAPDNGFDYTEKEKEFIYACKDNNKLDELFRMLFLKECTELGKVLPGLFTPTAGYVELLFNLSYLKTDGVVAQLLTIPEEDFKNQVEIVGWMYQYYNSEPKDDAFAKLKKNIKITKETLPAVTQLFTPDWIVRYMVENSLGRLWLEGHPNSKLKDKWIYYLSEAEQEASVQNELKAMRADRVNLKPEDIRTIDPCMGSGHILVYMFEVLMDIYRECGYTERDAAYSIVHNNLYGFDIDERAYQLSYFAVMMKGRQYDRRFFSARAVYNELTNNENKTVKIQPNVYEVRESNDLQPDFVQQLKKLFKNIFSEHDYACIEYVTKIFMDAKLYGTIIKVDEQSDVDGNRCYSGLATKVHDILTNPCSDWLNGKNLNILQASLVDANFNLLDYLLLQATILSEKYDVVITNPPYMGSSNMEVKLAEYVKNNYQDSKGDLSTCFMEKTIQSCKSTGFMAMINIPVWMFISSYEKLREKIIKNNTILTMAHLGRGIFGSDFGTTMFVISKNLQLNYNGIYRKIFDKTGSVDSIEKKEKTFLSGIGQFLAKQENFLSVPGYPIAYWISASARIAFSKYPALSNVAEPKQGIATADNNRFLRFWFEVSFENIGFKLANGEDVIQSKKKWVTYSKGGEFRKWFGNNNYVINWFNNGDELKHFEASVIRNQDYQLRQGLTWTWISVSYFGARFQPKGYVFDVAGSMLFSSFDNEMLLGYLCSKVADYFLKIINPTINFSNGVIAKLPVNTNIPNCVKKIANHNILISKHDWDSFETSWDFKIHPLLVNTTNADLKLCACGKNEKDKDYITNKLQNLYERYRNEVNEDFEVLKENEEELNRTFINLYGLQDELHPEEEYKDVTIHYICDNKEEAPESIGSSPYLLLKPDVIKSFISYAVGCMFGRYSLDVDGLAYAGGNWDTSKYKKYPVDQDNIIPITDEEYFDDDIVARFVEFVKIVCGKETLEENLKFIASGLDGNGTSKEIIRNYFIKEFYADHVKTYQKRPIYWLFDSGKENGFKALIYLHRYDKDTVGRVRTDYLHRMQAKLETESKRYEQICNMDDIPASEKAKARKAQAKIIKQLQEIATYDEIIAHVAAQRINLDLDDGVKVNYAKFQNIEVVQDDGRTIKRNLLAKI